MAPHDSFRAAAAIARSLAMTRGCVMRVRPCNGGWVVEEDRSAPGREDGLAPEQEEPRGAVGAGAGAPGAEDAPARTKPAPRDAASSDSVWINLDCEDEEYEEDYAALLDEYGDDAAEVMEELLAELYSDAECWARSEEEGWYYPD